MVIFGGSHADDLLPDYVTDKTFYLLFILYPLLSLCNVIYASLKFDKTFYLLAQFIESRLFSTRSRFMTAKTAPKVTLWGVLPAVRQNLHVTRGIIVVLRHYARHW